MFRKSPIFQILAFALFLQSCVSIDNDQDKYAPLAYGPTPTDAQLLWHQIETYCLIHFTPTTFQDKEWGFGDADPAIFNPTDFDAHQIAAAAKSAGFNGLVLVAKHHDGFCLWPTKTTEYNISKSPWKDGKGDMVKEFEQATRANHLFFGVYNSAWDRNYPAYGTPEYAEVYREQLRELYAGYGDLFISWHDGANGGDGYYGGANETRKIDRATYYGWYDKVWPITREMQPGAVIFSDVGPDVRWVGNEKGHAAETSWATFTPTGPDGEAAAPGHVDEQFLGTGQRDGQHWIPAECDVPQRPGWFYHADQDHLVKGPEELFDIYLKSVGRGANFNLGLAPNLEGRLHENDVAALEAFGEKVSKTFKENLAKRATFQASNVRRGPGKIFSTVNLKDGDRFSYWATDDDVTEAEIIVDLPKISAFDIIQLRENIKLGQRIDSVGIDIWEDNAWRPVAQATSIGSNRLIRLENPILVRRLRLRLYAPVAITLSDFGLFKEATVEYEAPSGDQAALPRDNWHIVEHNLTGADFAKAMDGAQSSFAIGVADELPGSVTIDLGEATKIRGFGYLPRQDNGSDGLVTHYTFETSIDGQRWKTVKTGEFSNVLANRINQVVKFGAVEARYIRFSANAVVGSGGQVSIAELVVY